MITQIGDWKVALGLEWLLPKSRAEIRTAKKSRTKQASVFISSEAGDWLGFHAGVNGGVYAGALLVSMVEPNAVVYCPLNEEMGWICAISEGMPVVGYDEVLPISEARAKAKDWSNLFNNADIVGDLAGAKATVQDILKSLQDELEAKAISKKQLAGAMLTNDGISFKRIGVMAVIVFGVSLLGWGAKTYKETQERQERDRLTLQEAAKRVLAEKLNQEKVEAEREAAAKNLAQQVAEARAAMKERVSPALVWGELTRVRRAMPLSQFGYRPQSYECGAESCKVEWLGAGLFTNQVDKLRLPGVDRSLSNDLKATSTFELKGTKDVLPKTSATNVDELAFLIQSRFNAKVDSFTSKPAQPITVSASKGGQEPQVIGHVGKWHMTVQGGTALLQVGDIVQLMARWPMRITSIKYQPTASSVDLDGEYMFVVE